MFLIIVQLQFEGFHRWGGAPTGLDYLSKLHRHVFHIKAYRKVDHAQRDVEFITLKHQMQHDIQQKQESDHETENWSCESWAQWLADRFNCFQVEVYEDGENGGAFVRD